MRENVDWNYFKVQEKSTQNELFHIVELVDGINALTEKFEIK